MKKTRQAWSGEKMSGRALLALARSRTKSTQQQATEAGRALSVWRQWRSAFIAAGLIKPMLIRTPKAKA